MRGPRGTLTQAVSKAQTDCKRVAQVLEGINIFLKARWGSHSHGIKPTGV